MDNISNEIISEDAKLAVKRGIYWLDENHPGWEKKIDLDVFDISSCSSCVIGQAIGEYSQAVRDITNSHRAQDYIPWAVEHGFESPQSMPYNNLGDYGNYGYKEIETLWTEEVERRL